MSGGGYSSIDEENCPSKKKPIKMKIGHKRIRDVMHRKIKLRIQKERRIKIRREDK